MHADHLKHTSQDELVQNLAISFAEYAGKNPLVIISEDSRQLNKFPKRAGVELRSMNDIFTLMQQDAFSEVPTGMISSDLNTNDHYTQVETDAVCRIQRFWRSRIPKLKQHRAYMQTPEAKVIGFFMTLSSRRPTPTAFRALLLTRGVMLHLKFPEFREMMAEQHRTIMSCIMNTEIPDQLGEILDEALRLNSQVNETLKAAIDRMSEERLGALTSQDGLRDTLDFVENAIGDVERGIQGARKMIDDVSSAHRP